MVSNSAESIEENYLQYKGKYRGLFGWVFSTDHKRIGLLYLITMSIFFIVGIFLGLLIRLELFNPGPDLMTAAQYNALFTLHGVIMIFLVAIPGIPASMGNFFLPIHIGAKDVSFPRINLLSWWLFVIGGSLALISLFTGGGTPDTGWTFYVPYSLHTGTNVSLAVFAAFILGFSSILTGLNFITTVHRLRAPGMHWGRMPLFVWGLYATAWIQLMATPIVAITLVLVIVDRLFGIGIFDPAHGGDPVLFEHLFWIYSHPAVYIMILPAMGVVSEIIPVFSRKQIFGYWFIACSSMLIAIVGYLVWGHHMFVSGMADFAAVIFSFLTFLVAIPTAIKIFNWTATMYGGSISLDPPMLYALTFMVLFSVGGLTGLVNGALAADIHIHDTYFVVGHFHYTIFGGEIIGLFAGLHYWWPKMFGKMYHKMTATIAWAMIFIGFNTLYGTMMVLGFQGMPRRYFTYLPQFTSLQRMASCGSFILIAGLLLMIGNLFYSLFRGKKANRNPWGGATLEWQVSSPPPHENFHEIPFVEKEPYDFQGIEVEG